MYKEHHDLQPAVRPHTHWKRRGRFPISEVAAVLDLREFVGRAPEQVVEFVENEVDPVIARHRGQLEGIASDVRV